MRMTFACPAKINLTLEVLDRRDDGYHALRSVMVPLELADELRIEPAQGFSFSCNDPALAGDDNLAVRAVRVLDRDATVKIDLTKWIPSQAGLGGGSSDAAGVLRAAMTGAFGRRFDVDWLATARSLGSDVPFFLAESGALVEGTGERVTAVGALPRWHVLVVKPPAAVSTAAAYAQLDLLPRRSRPRNTSTSLACVDALQRGDFAAVIATMNNDFHDVIAASTPPVARAIDALHRAGASKALLAGSGSAVFTLERDAGAVGSIARRLDLDESYARFETAFAPTQNWRGGVA
jgi:4-diphosphocytidyl-2-C-methyl-D-erythritol kinase